MASLLERIQASIPDLSKSERKVASAILDDPALCVTQTIGQLAKRANVSEPTVHRFCKHYGANGFPDFKLALTANLSKSSVRKVRQVESGDSVEDIVHKVCSGLIYALQNNVMKTDSSKLARAIDLISQARRIVICACGFNSSSALFMQEQLLAIGLKSEYEEDSLKLNLCAVSLRPGDLLLCFSASGEDKEAVALCKALKEQGVSVICLCPDNSVLYDLSTINIAIGKKEALGEDLAAVYLMHKVYIKILVSGVKLRRSDLIGAYRERINDIYMRSLLTLNTRDNTLVENRSGSGSDDLLKPDEPITTINWNF